MGFVIKINALEQSDVEGYYTGRIHYYSNESVAVPGHVDEKDNPEVKVYKLHKNAINAMNKILTESSFVRSCDIEEC